MSQDRPQASLIQWAQINGRFLGVIEDPDSLDNRPKTDQLLRLICQFVKSSITSKLSEKQMKEALNELLAPYEEAVQKQVNIDDMLMYLIGHEQETLARFFYRNLWKNFSLNHRTLFYAAEQGRAYTLADEMMKDVADELVKEEKINESDLGKKDDIAELLMYASSKLNSKIVEKLIKKAEAYGWEEMAIFSLMKGLTTMESRLYHRELLSHHSYDGWDEKVGDSSRRTHTEILRFLGKIEDVELLKKMVHLCETQGSCIGEIRLNQRTYFQETKPRNQANETQLLADIESVKLIAREKNWELDQAIDFFSINAIRKQKGLPLLASLNEAQLNYSDQLVSGLQRLNYLLATPEDLNVFDDDAELSDHEIKDFHTKAQDLLLAHPNTAENLAEVLLTLYHFKLISNDLNDPYWVTLNKYAGMPRMINEIYADFNHVDFSIEDNFNNTIKKVEEQLANEKTALLMGLHRRLGGGGEVEGKAESLPKSAVSLLADTKVGGEPKVLGFVFDYLHGPKAAKKNKNTKETKDDLDFPAPPSDNSLPKPKK